VNSRQHSDEELNAFERQLRSAIPRAANFALPDVAPSVALSQADHVAPSQPSPPKRKSTWAAMLLASWSLGAAAGVMGTLACARLQMMPAPEPPLTQKAQPDPSSQLPPLRKPAPAGEPSSAVADDLDNSPKAVQAMEPDRPANRLGWGIFPRRTLGENEGAILTPIRLSHVEQAEVSVFAWQSDRQPSGWTNPETEVVESKQTSADQRSISPAPSEVVPPASQRDMLRELLDTYSSVY
jgi:hypothetical protein